MQLPALLPNHFEVYAAAKTDSALLEQLTKQPSDLTILFEYACNHETWSEEHAPFMHAAMTWMTEQFLQGHLSYESAKRVGKAIQDHYRVLEPLIPRNITFRVDEQEFPVNSLLFGISSEYFRDLMRLHWDLRKETILLKNVSIEFVRFVVEFVETGAIIQLWRLSKEELFIVLRQAVSWGLLGMAQLTEETLKRYIAEENVVDMLILSHEESWKHLLRICCDFLNDRSWGIRCEPVLWESSEEPEIKPLAVEFLDFGYRALDVFEKLRQLVTHLICGGSLMSEGDFGRVVRGCPRLISLNVSHSRLYSEQLVEIIAHLRELNLGNCPWLTDALLKMLIPSCTHLEKLGLSGNLQLTYASWGELQKLKKLRSLDIARCHQIHDEDFSLILKASPQLTHLDLEDCKSLSNKAFFELARNLPHLAVLNVSRCHISDGLLLEIVSRCRSLRALDLSRCLDVTAKGLLQLVGQASSLQRLIIRRCNVSPEAIQQLKQMRPALSIIT